MTRQPLAPMRGDQSFEIAEPADETALVLMHVWNVGILPELAWKPDGPAGGVMLMAEWAARRGLAAQAGFEDAVEALLDAGADPNAAAFDGSTPLSAAVAKGRDSAASLLRARGGH